MATNDANIERSRDFGKKLKVFQEQQCSTDRKSNKSKLRSK